MEAESRQRAEEPLADPNAQEHMESGSRDEWMPLGTTVDERRGVEDVEEWLRRERSREGTTEPGHEDLLEAEWEDQQAMRDESPAWVDLSEVDEMYAASAGRGMADTSAMNTAVDIAVERGAARQARPGQPQPMPSQRERARAAQRWEQNREYVEARHQERRQ